MGKNQASREEPGAQSCRAPTNSEDEELRSGTKLLGGLAPKPETLNIANVPDSSHKARDWVRPGHTTTTRGSHDRNVPLRPCVCGEDSTHSSRGDAVSQRLVKSICLQKHIQRKVGSR